MRVAIAPRARRAAAVCPRAMLAVAVQRNDRLGTLRRARAAMPRHRLAPLPRFSALRSRVSGRPAIAGGAVGRAVVHDDEPGNLAQARAPRCRACAGLVVRRYDDGHPESCHAPRSPRSPGPRRTPPAPSTGIPPAPATSSGRAGALHRHQPRDVVGAEDVLRHRRGDDAGRHRVHRHAARGDFDRERLAPRRAAPPWPRRSWPGRDCP